MVRLQAAVQKAGMGRGDEPHPCQEMLRIRCGEFNVLRTLRHPHIVNVLNFWTHDNEAVLAMELHSQSNLQQVVRKASTMDEMTSKHLFKMLVLNGGVFFDVWS